MTLLLASPLFVSRAPALSLSSSILLPQQLSTLALNSTHQSHPNHLPVLFSLEAKYQSLAELAKLPSSMAFALELAGMAKPLKWSPQAFEDLQAEVLSVFSASEILWPDAFIPGGMMQPQSTNLAPNQSDARMQPNVVWPTLEESRGKVVFVLQNLELLNVYCGEPCNVTGRPFWVEGDAKDDKWLPFMGSDDAARAREEVKQGYVLSKRGGCLLGCRLR